MPVARMPGGHDSRDGYEPHFFETLARIEDRHFWFRFRNRVLLSLVQDVVKPLPSGFRMLEAGCGNGNVLRFLSNTLRQGLVIGIDLFDEGLRIAKSRTGAPLVQGDIHAPPFRCRFDVIGAFDVIEHLRDDRQPLRDFHSLLADNGALLVTVPAHSSLWSYFDEASGHCRRYSRSQLESTLAQCGFRVEYITEFMMPLYPLLWLTRRANGRRRNPGSATAEPLPDLRVIPILNRLMLLLLSCELPLLRRRIRLPIGSSLLAVARRV
jgi:SAM-dependent methyltransferase